jgi:hypothetical protein
MMRRSPALCLATLACAGAVACTTPAAVPDAAPLGPGMRSAPIVPDALDHASADLAVGVLADDPELVVRALGALEVAERSDPEAIGPSGLVPAGLEAASAVLHRGREGRAAAEGLLARDDLDDASRERIERQLADDPLLLARDAPCPAR